MYRNTRKLEYESKKLASTLGSLFQPEIIFEGKNRFPGAVYKDLKIYHDPSFEKGLYIVSMGIYLESDFDLFKAFEHLLILLKRARGVNRDQAMSLVKQLKEVGFYGNKPKKKKILRQKKTFALNVYSNLNQQKGPKLTIY